MKKLPSVSFKYIYGKEYLYIQSYNEEKSRAKRKSLMEAGASPKEIRHKGSGYDHISLGRWDLDNPSDKLLDFLRDKPDEYVLELENRFQERKRKRELDRIKKIKKESTLQQSE